MFYAVVILSIIASILLVLIVLIQNPKGGGIAANFSAANQIAGVKRTNDFVEKATWTLAVALLVFSMSSGYLHKSGGTQESILQEQLENGGAGVEGNILNQERAEDFNTAPAGPVEAPKPIPANPDEQ